MPVCALCEATVDEEFLCYGCGAFICDKHPDAPWGTHLVDAHDYEPCDACGENPELCACD